MARKGSFGAGLSPFGSGTLGSLSAYDIGSDLADLSVYQTEVAWGNGLATDADYLASLRQAVDVADPTTQKYFTAQNKLDDAVYRIGRNVADNAGLDALIAFDQSALATMNSENLRYRDVLDSLQAELAQRRSRDYGDLVNAYNDGSLPTEALLEWVSRTLGTITPDDPDYANWTNVADDLGDRVVGEKDSAVYQDFQRGRMTSEAFLAYITGRRDSYSPASPKYQEWAAKVEDATVQIKQAAQSKADSTFFGLYEEGKKSDASYLLYLRRRIDGMTPDDPQRGEWQHRLNQAAFSLAEDKLRFDAERASSKVDAQTTYVKGRTVTVTTKATTRKELVNGKWTTVAVPAGTQEKVIAGHWTAPSGANVGAAQAAMGKLMDFYTSYRSTLNPGSAEWRTVTRSIDSLTRSQATFAMSTTKGTGTAGSATGSSTGSSASRTAPATAADGKLINPKYTLSNILGLFAVNPTGEKKAVAAATKSLALNLSTLNNALTRGDDVWLFQDPRYPGSLVNALNPDGSPIMTGAPPDIARAMEGGLALGKPVLVRGTVYLPVRSEAFSNLKTVQSSNFMAAAELALSKGKLGDYASLTRQAGESLDAARLQDAQYRAQNWSDWYKATKTAVDQATMAGDYGTALKLSTDLASRLAQEAQNPYLDDTRRATLNELGQQLADNKIVPRVNPDGSGSEGAVNLSELARGNVVLNPGWHHVLKSNDRGQPQWGPVFDDKQDGSWEAKHITVYTTLGEKLVQGEAVISPSARLDPVIYVLTPEGRKAISAGGTAEELTFVDENGLVQRAYSIDGGRTWIRPGPGMPAPTLEFNANLRLSKDAKGIATYVDSATGDVVLGQNAGGGWDLSPDYAKANPQGLAWYGQAAWEAAKASAAFNERLTSGDPRRVNPDALPMGAPNQHMTLAYASPSGIVNLTPAGYRTQSDIAADRRRLSSAGGGRTPATVTGQGRGFGPPSVQAPLNMVRALELGLAPPPQGRTTAATINVQLPADTPARYDGYGPPRPGPTITRLAPSSVLPALTQPLGSRGSVPVPALRAAVTTLTLGSKDDAFVTPPRLVVAKPPTTTVKAPGLDLILKPAAKPPPPPPKPASPASLGQANAL